MTKRLNRLCKIIAIFALMISLTACKTQKQKDIRELSNYINLSYEGADGHARAKTEFNKEKAKKDIGTILKMNKKDETEKLKLQRLLDSLEINILNNSDELKNGDELKIEISCDEELRKYFDLSLNEKQVVKVAGLIQPKDMDVFTLIDISYEGFSPALKVDIKKNETSDSFLKTINFNVVEDPPYERGQTINIEARIDPDLARKYSYNIKNTIKEVKIPRELPYYVENQEEMTDNYIFTEYYKGYDKILKERDKLASFVSSKIKTDPEIREELSDPKSYIDSNLNIELEDALFSVSEGNLQTSEKSEDGNYLVFVYKVDVNNAKYKIPSLYVSYKIKAITKDSNSVVSSKEGQLGKYDVYYDNIMIDYANGLDDSYKTYKIDNINTIIETKNKRLKDLDHSEEYKNKQEENR